MRLYHAGDRGEPVRDIQRRLAGLELPVTVTPDGVFGPETERAVRSFQESRGLSEDGIVGPATWRALVDAGYRLGDRLLYRRSPMMRGDDVSRLQQSLGALGFDAGKVDGIFGPDTLRAVLDFQRNRGMPEDGLVGRGVVKELSLVARATDKPVRAVVRDHAWIDSLPRPIAGARIYVDPDRGGARGSPRPWTVATALVAELQRAGARPLLSRSVDTSPTEHQRAERANRLDVQVVVSLVVPSDGHEGVYYFGTSLSTSDAGRVIATHIAPRLSLDAAPKAFPLLKETRSPAVIVAADPFAYDAGIRIARALIDLYASGPAPSDRTASS